MITLSKSGNAIVFEFDSNPHYLYNGTIEVPINSLLLVTDDSQMATLKKAATNDIFISALYSELGMSKSELETFYKENMVGDTGGGSESGVTSGEVQSMIDESISGKADTTAVTAAISTATADFFDGVEYDSGTTRINFYHGSTIKGYVDASAFIVDGMIDNVSIQTLSGVSYLVIDFNTASGKEDIYIPLTDIFNPSNYYTKTEVDSALSGKVDTSAMVDYYTTAQTNSAIEAATSGKVDTSAYTAYTAATDTVLGSKADTSAVTASINAAVSGKADTSAFTAYTSATDSRIAEDEEVTARALNELEASLSGKADTSAVTASINAAVSGKADTSAVTAVDNVLTAHTANTQIHVTTAQTAAWDAKQAALTAGNGISIDTANTISVTASSNNVIEVTQAQYDALVSAGTVDLTALYVITDAQSVDISNYYTKSEVDSSLSGKADVSAVTEVSTALSGKQDTLIAGDNITISGNVISADGGGKAIEAGRGISITTGATADTVSFNLPISADSTNLLFFGNNNTINNASSKTNNILFGSNNKLSAATPYRNVVSNLMYGDYNKIELSGSYLGGTYNSTIGQSNRIQHNVSSYGQATDLTSNFLYGYNNQISGKTNYTILFGQQNISNGGDYSSSFGYGNTLYKNYQYAFGQNHSLANEGETAFGKYSNSVSASTTFGDSGNTLFSVGNGTASNARHNAFEIRQNGDIYCNNGTSDVKLQDYLQVKVVQISQSDYDQLQNKDANTLYVITNS